MSKERVTVTLDADLIRAGQNAVERGAAESLSAWINLAILERREKDRRIQSLARAVADYDKTFGTITPEEIAAQQRADRAAARVVRTGGGRRRQRRRPSAAR
jgi:hypothetical protein